MPLAPVLAEALALLQPMAQANGIALPSATSGLPDDGQAAAIAQADPVRLKQVLLNLLANAIKDNRPQGQVLVQCQGPADAGGVSGSAGWQITVQDTRPGLDAAQQARLFSAFDRLGADAGHVEGAGMGLALSRGLVRAMGGEIGVHSTPGVGSSFWVRLPAAQVVVAPAGGGQAAAPARIWRWPRARRMRPARRWCSTSRTTRSTCC